jgi:tight adherence protein B
MNSTLIIVVVVTATALFVIACALLIYDLLRYRLLVSERLEGLSGAGKNDLNASVFKDLKQLSAEQLSARFHWRARFRDSLEQANLPLGPPLFLLISLGCGTALGGLSFAASKQLWIAPFGLAIGILAPLAYVRVKCLIRIRRLSVQLPEAFDYIGRAVRAGQTTTAAIQTVGDEFEWPIADEFRRCYEEQNLGMPYDTALRNLASRSGIMELRIFVVALLLHSRSGGNLVELLANLSSLVRTRVKLQQKLKALTGEGRMQAAVLIVLPMVAFVALHILSREYIATLLQRPWLLATAFGGQLVGAVWIRQIIKSVN